jgi:2-dehydropantoate 2-reductase
MRLGIIGAGAIGCVVGGLLTRGGHDVTLIDQWPDHVESMRRVGLRLSGTCGEHLIPVTALHIHEAQSVDEPFDAVFIAVKSYDTEWATHLGLAYLKPGGVVVDFQNGINDERVAAIAGKERTLGCVITISAGLYDPGHAIRSDTGTLGFKIGEQDGTDTPRAQELVRAMNAVAPTQLTTNLWGERWSKLTVNCMVNPVCGLSGLGSMEARTQPEIQLISIQLGSEVIQTGRAAGYEAEPIYGIAAQRFVDAAAGRGVAEIQADMAASGRSRGGGRPSMLQDVMRGRRTEINYLNGYVSQRGRELGVKTPFNDAIVDLMNSFPVGALRPDVKHLEPLLRMLPVTTGS